MKQIVLILFCTLMLTGCTFAYKNGSMAPATESATHKTSASVSTEEIIPLNASVYYGNENADGFEIQIFQVERLDTATLIEKLIEIGVLSEGTKVISEKLVGRCLHLDFNSEFKQHICSMGTSGEYIIIGSLVNTLLDNFQDAIESVYITVNGEILESGHVIYDFELTHQE